MSKQFEDHYGTLGIDQKATNEQIRTVYIRLIRQWHPDKNPGQVANAHEFCVKINRAYTVLSDPVLRRDYDRIYNVHSNQKESQRSQSQGQRNNSSHHQQENAKSKNDRGYQQYNQHQNKNQDQQNKRSYNQENAKSSNKREYKKNNEYQGNTGNQENKKNNQSKTNSNEPHQHGHQDRNNYENQRGYQNQNNGYSRWHEQRNNQDWSNHNSQYENFKRNRSGADNTNLYDILGLKNNAKKQDIASAFRKLAMKYGDSENPAVKRQFQKILGAYLVLSDPVLRANYDRENNNNNNSNNNERRSNYGTFTFFSDEHFDEWRSSFFDNPGIWKAICLVCIGGGYVLIIICKWTVIILYHVAKLIIKILPPLLFILGKLICIIVPPLFKGSIFLLTGLAKCIGWSFKMLLRCVIG